MGYRDYYKGPLKDYHRDPFQHSLLSTKEMVSCKAGLRLHLFGETG